MKTLKHGDRATINSKRVHFGSVVGYAQQYNDDVQASVNRAVKNGHEQHWITLESSTMCGDPGYYERDRAEWANVPALSIGDRVAMVDTVDGVEQRTEFVIVSAPNQNYRLATPLD